MARDYFDELSKVARAVQDMTRPIEDVERLGGMEALRERTDILKKFEALTGPSQAFKALTRSAMTEMADDASAVFRGLTRSSAFVEAATRMPPVIVDSLRHAREALPGALRNLVELPDSPFLPAGLRLAPAGVGAIDAAVSAVESPTGARDTLRALRDFLPADTNLLASKLGLPDSHPLLQTFDLAREWSLRLDTPAFAESIAGRILTTFDDLATAEDEEAVQEVVRTLRQLLAEWIAALPAHWRTAQFYRDLVLVVGVYWGLYGYLYAPTQEDIDSLRQGQQEIRQELRANRDEFRERMQALTETFEEGQRQLVDAMDAVRGSVVAPAERVATKEVSVRAEPTMDSARIAKLRVNQIVDVIEERGDWVHVRFIDADAGGIDRIGWVAAKYLTTLPTPE